MWTTFQSFTLRDNNKHKATLWDTKYLSVKFRPNVECDQVVTGRTCIAVVIAFAAVSLADYCLPIIWHNRHFNKNVYLMMPSTSETEIVWIQKYLISKYTWQTFCSHDLHLKNDHYHLNRLLLNLLESVKSHRQAKKF